MQGYRQKSVRGRRRRRKGRSEPKSAPEPIIVAARRPNSPLLNKPTRSGVAASAKPRASGQRVGSPKEQPRIDSQAPPPRRVARIVAPAASTPDEQEVLRSRLLQRIILSEGRGAVTRAADDFIDAGFAFPEEQQVQLQLLEHFDDARAREALGVLARILDEEPPIKRPLFEQRLRRIEEHAEDLLLREEAASLRRVIRS